jgi:hypothetical protein
MEYRIGNNVTGPFSFPFSSERTARSALRKEILAIAIRAVKNSDGRISFEEARVIAKDYCWLCDENEKIIS